MVFRWSLGALFLWKLHLEGIGYYVQVEFGRFISLKTPPGRYRLPCTGGVWLHFFAFNLSEFLFSSLQMERTLYFFPASQKVRLGELRTAAGSGWCVPYRAHRREPVRFSYGRRCETCGILTDTMKESKKADSS